MAEIKKKTTDKKENENLEIEERAVREEKRMKKKVLSVFLCTAMAVSMLVGCGGQDVPAEAPAEAAPAEWEAADAATEAAENAVADALSRICMLVTQLELLVLST